MTGLFSEDEAPVLITIADQITAVKRELSFRERVYRTRVAEGKMSQGQSDLEIARMTAVLETLQGRMLFDEVKLASLEAPAGSVLLARTRRLNEAEEETVRRELGEIARTLDVVIIHEHADGQSLSPLAPVADAIDYALEHYLRPMIPSPRSSPGDPNVIERLEEALRFLRGDLSPRLDEPDHPAEDFGAGVRAAVSRSA